MCAVYQENTKRILIIDDDLDLLMLLERRLLKEGFEVETAASLDEAEEIITYFNPHLILLDINVNGEDGRSLCWKLKKTNTDNNLKVLMMSGHDYSKGRASLFGADDLLPKPIVTDYLLHQVNTYLNTKKTA
jgi:DNA-binding response OmpR family regulator